jgi:uncharacterized protein YcaQ
MPLWVRYDKNDPTEVAAFKELLASNPCVEELGWVSEEAAAEHWHMSRASHPEWREELADYRDLIAEHTAEELDQMQLDARAKLPDKRLILARGGF